MGSSAWMQSKIVVILAILAALGAILLFRNTVYPQAGVGLPLMIAESSSYAQMARGETAQVSSPFSKRFLFPFLAGIVARGTGWPERAAFLVLDAASAVLLVACVTVSVESVGFSPWLAAALLITPAMVDRCELGYMPDLFQGALLALFFLLVLRERNILALVVLALSFMTRENTLVLCLVLGVIAVRARRPGLAAGTALVAVYGIVFGSIAGRLGQPNRHHLPDFVYMALKLPDQFLKNILGLRLWSNTLDIGQPVFKMAVPGWLKLGDVHEVGICAPDVGIPLFTLITLLTLFGTAPLLVWLSRGEWRRGRPPLAVQLAGVYGLIAYFLGTSVGDWIDRLIGDGWPLFWIALPWALARARERNVAFPTGTCLASLAVVAWMPRLLYYSRFGSNTVAFSIVALALVAYGFTWRRLRGSFPR